MGKEELLERWESDRIVTDRRVLQAFREVPREEFMPPDLRQYAYDDEPAGIGEGQTISQPTTVMLMTQALEVKEGQKVLEVGAGSGYQAAILAKMVGKKGKVISTEAHARLVSFAKENLHKTGITNVTVLRHDGSTGYEKEAPYDRIILTAACEELPQPLLDQLADNGILLAPVGDITGQTLIRTRKDGKTLTEEKLGSFIFVPLTGRYGKKSR